MPQGISGNFYRPFQRNFRDLFLIFFSNPGKDKKISRINSTVRGPSYLAGNLSSFPRKNRPFPRVSKNCFFVVSGLGANFFQKARDLPKKCPRIRIAILEFFFHSHSWSVAASVRALNRLEAFELLS
jgi:hypothetical protein